MQASHTARGVDLATIAHASGFAMATTIATSDELTSWLPTLHNAEGPVFGVIKVAANQPALIVPARDGTYIKHRFREALLGPKAVM
jgi:hypothetical protein